MTFFCSLFDFGRESTDVMTFEEPVLFLCSENVSGPVGMVLNPAPLSNSWAYPCWVVPMVSRNSSCTPAIHNVSMFAKLGALRWVLELNFNEKIIANIFASICEMLANVLAIIFLLKFTKLDTLKQLYVEICFYHYGY